MSETPDLDLLAAEYVLGTLDGDEAAEAARLLATDTAFAAAVRGWEQRLAPLAAVVPPVPPPPGLWDRIAASTTAPTATPAPALTEAITATASAASASTMSASITSAASRSATTVGSATTAMSAATSPAAAMTRPTTAVVVPLALRRRLRIWQASTAAALAIAASLAAFIVLRSPPPLDVAVLTPRTGEGPVLLATAEPNGALSVRSNGTIAVPNDRDLELWALAAGETRPRSLGVLPAAGGRLVVASLAPGTQLMVSLEPRGGSPTGQPTGPVLYAGQLAAVD